MYVDFLVNSDTSERQRSLQRDQRRPALPATDKILLDFAVGLAQQHVKHVCLPQAHQGVLHEAVVWQAVPHHVTQRLKQRGGRG